MKLKYILTSALILLLPIISYSTEKKIVATIKPIHSIILNVVDNEDVHLLLNGNVSPHDYHLKPSDMKKIKEADIVFYVDDESIETFLHRALKTIDDRNKVAIFSNSRIKLLPIREGGIWEEELAEDGHNHAHGEYDGHIWLSTNNAIRITKQVVKKLSEITPSKKNLYKKNAMIYINQLKNSKKEISAELASIKNEPYIVFHDAYQYFENEFKLNAAGSISLNPEISPTPKRINEIKSKILDDNVKCVFKEPQFPSQIVQTITKDTKANEGTLDPLGSELEPGKELYIKLIKNISKNLKQCLS
ncbi:zinc ABC transporter substrate-binding protein [bacterium]|nr:zinc ABC transporter substrate-binding protein [bacterium]